MKQIDKIIQSALVKFNVLSQDEMDSYVADTQLLDESLRDYLLQKSIVTEKQILISLSQALNLETIDFKELHVEKKLLETVPVKFVWYYKFMPISIDGNKLTVATNLPYDLKTLDDIRLHLGYEIKVVLMEESHLLEALKKYYGLASDTLDKIMSKHPVKVNAIEAGTGQWIEDLEKSSTDPTVSNLVNQIILEAYKKRATDIHIEPYRNKVRFRYRIDGVLVDAHLPDQVKHLLQPILSRIKILANLSITEKRIPQDGSAVVKTKEQNLDLRVSTIPTPRGESMVIRILPTEVMHLSLEKLGFDRESESQFRNLIKKPHGVIFITGPTGSGKTTTLYACLNEINAPERKIITIEDPVEYEMEGITQIQVNSKLDFSFSSGLRSVLRHDPDIIMVGEVRDLETAEIAIRTALTGHLVFSTLHTNDSASGVTRLIDMGVEPYLVASSVEAFVAQRLVRVICPKCKCEETQVPAGIKEEIAHSLGIKSIDEVKVYRGNGCDNCNNTGFYGRIAIYEILTINDSIRGAILEKPRANYIKNIALKEGLNTLRQSGWKAVINGVTTPSEVLNVTVKDDFAAASIDKINIVSTKNVQESVASDKEFKEKRIKTSDKWEKKNQYDARVYPRSSQPVEIRYRLLKFDPKDHEYLLPETVEYTSVTEDISAGGLRFISKMFFPIGSILEVKINIPTQQLSVTCLARVCRLEEDSLDNIYTMVNYYLDLSSKDRALIARYVDATLEDNNNLVD